MLLISTRKGPFTSHSERVAAALCDLRGALMRRIAQSGEPAHILTVRCCLQVLCQFVIATRGATLAEPNATLRGDLKSVQCDDITRMLAVAVLAELDADVAQEAAWLADAIANIPPAYEAAAWDTLARLVEVVGVGACESAARAVQRNTPGSAHVLAQMLRHGQGAELFGAACDLASGRRVLADSLADLALADPSSYPGHLARLLADADDDVRAAAARSLGVLIQEARADHGLAARVLLGDAAAPGAVYDVSAHVRTRAAWSFANWCALPDNPCAWASLADAALYLAADDRTAMHALRALGPLLYADPANVRAPSLVAVLRAGLGARAAPKVRWNAASSLARGAITDPGATRDACAEALCGALHDRTFKVKLIAAEALCDERVYARVSPGTRACIRSAAAQAAASVDVQLAQASFAEAKLHGHKCRDALFLLVKVVVERP